MRVYRSSRAKFSVDRFLFERKYFRMKWRTTFTAFAANSFSPATDVTNRRAYLAFISVYWLIYSFLPLTNKNCFDSHDAKHLRSKRSFAMMQNDERYDVTIWPEQTDNTKQKKISFLTFFFLVMMMMMILVRWWWLL